MLERIPPQNIEAEMAVLGAMLLGERAAIERASELLLRDDFYREAHARIYEAMLAISEKGEPVDIVTLSEELQRRNHLELVGGLAYMMQLGEFVPTTSNVTYYARIVQQKAILRKLIETSSQIAGLAYEDPDSVDVLVDQAEKLMLDVGQRRRQGGFTPLKPLLSETFDKIEHLYSAKDVTTGVDTGFIDLNYMTSGLQKGDLIIVAARPSMGKTALTLTMGQNAALMGKTVAVFSLEMSKESLTQRMMCSEARVDAHRLRTGHLHADDWTRLAEAVDRLWKCNLFIDDTTDMSALEMRSKCRRLKAEHGLDMVIVDYLQLMRGSSKDAESRNYEITEIARGLKNLAREMDCPVVALSQLSRRVEQREDKRPMLSDLRESGSIESEADIVGFIYRPAYYARKETVTIDNDDQKDAAKASDNAYNDAEEAEFIIAKQRNGPTGTVKLAFIPKFARFENLAQRSDDSLL